MPRPRKHDDRQIEMIDVFGGDECRDETPQERTARLASVRSRALRRRQEQTNYWWYAVSEVARRYKDGQQLPIHFDIVYRASSYSQRLRMSLIGADAMPEVGKYGLPMSHDDWLLLGWRIAKRPREVGYDFAIGD